jgi:hypothetical protein
MSKVLIDRELLERVQERLDPHRDAVLWGAVCDTFHTAPSGTPAMPVKAYYYESPNLDGIRTRSVGLEVRKAFIDAPLVLESDAMECITYLEGEIAKRDETIARLEPQLNRAIQANYDLREELAACRVAVENCDLLRARIVELEALSVTKVMLDIVPGDGDGYEVYAKSVSDVETKLGALGEENEELQFERDQLRAELAAIKAQEPVGFADITIRSFAKYKSAMHCLPLYAAAVSEAKAQGVVMPPSPYMPGVEPAQLSDYERGEAQGRCDMWSEVARLNAAPVQQPKCKTCNDNGMIGGPSFYAPDECGDPCSDCSAPAQQVSVPDEREAFEKWGETLFYTACFERHENDEYVGRGLQGAWLGWQARAELNAAPAAPAADAGLAEALKQAFPLFDEDGLNELYHHCEIAVLGDRKRLHKLLAAHRAKGAES